MNKLNQLLLCLAISCGLVHTAPALADGPSESVIGPDYHDAAEVKAKGYQYQYVFAKAGKHVDRRVVNQTLPEALE